MQEGLENPLEAEKMAEPLARLVQGKRRSGRSMLRGVVQALCEARKLLALEMRRGSQDALAGREVQGRLHEELRQAARRGIV